MPKAKKPKVTPVPHRMTLRSRRGAQAVTSATLSHAPVARASSNATTSGNNLPVNHGTLVPSAPTNRTNDTSAAASSTHQPAGTQDFPKDLDVEYPATQVVASGRQFSQTTVRELGNVDAVLVDRDEPPTQDVVSRVSLLRRGLEQLSNLYPPPEIDERTQTQLVGSGAVFSNSMVAEMDNVPPPSAITEPATQVVMSARFSNNEVKELANIDTAALGVEGPSTQVVDSAVPFSQGMLGQLANTHSAATIAEEPDTQVVISAAPFPQGTPRQSANVHPVPANDDMEATQVIPSWLPFSERMVGELGDVNLANIAISPPSATAHDDDDYGYDEGSTIRYASETGQSETIPDVERIPDGDTINDRALVEAQSSRPLEKSWASGSLTSSMRVAIGLLPKPLSNGRVRSLPEDLGTPPPRYPCLVRITHYTCGHSYKQIEHHDRCRHDDGPSERIIRAATPETPVLDEWGLPPSAQRPGRIPCSEKETMLLGGTECEECIAER